MQSRRSDGRVLDSGEFTISSQEALRKLTVVISHLMVAPNTKVTDLLTYLRRELNYCLESIASRASLPNDIREMLQRWSGGQSTTSLSDICIQATGPKGMGMHKHR